MACGTLWLAKKVCIVLTLFLSSIHVTVPQNQNSLLLKMKMRNFRREAFLEEVKAT
jgi:hypothetical protein